MIYFNLGVMGISLYLKIKNNDFLLASFFMLSLSCLIRKEMLFFSLIPILYLNYNNLISDRVLKLKLFLIFFFVAYLYHFRMLYIYYMNEGETFTSFTGHGGYSVILVTFTALLLSLFLKPFNFFKKINILQVTLFFGVLTLFVIYFVKPNETYYTIYSLYLLLFYTGGWGIFWFIIFKVIFLIFLFYLFYKNIFNLSVKNDNLDHKIICFLLFIILMFFLGRTILYIFYDSVSDTGFWASGNRILLLIYPTSVTLTLYFMKLLIFRKNSSS